MREQNVSGTAVRCFYQECFGKNYSNRPFKAKWRETWQFESNLSDIFIHNLHQMLHHSKLHVTFWNLHRRYGFMSLNLQSFLELKWKLTHKSQINFLELVCSFPELSLKLQVPITYNIQHQKFIVPFQRLYFISSKLRLLTWTTGFYEVAPAFWD